MIPFLDNALKAIRIQYYDDLVDRLNYYYSTLILLFMAVLVSAKQYVGDPIDCWFPAEFRPSWEQYAESYCFISSTYFIPSTERLSIEKHIDRQARVRKINYYQWIPLMLALQGLLFYMPNLIWKMLNWQSGINVKAILKMASDADISDDEKRKKTLKTLAKYIEDSLDFQSALGSVNEFRQFFCFRCGKRANTYLTCLYIFSKILYILNIFGQLFMLSHFFDTNYISWGFDVMWNVARGKEWVDTGHFPRVTLCDFAIRDIGQDLGYSVQCVLTINMFNEKIYLFLWIWLLFVGFCTCVNFLYWAITLLPSCFRFRFIHKYLRIAADEPFNQQERELIQKFVSKCLRSDGVLLMRFISGHTGDLLVIELMFRLFQHYINRVNSSRKENGNVQLFPSSVSSNSFRARPTAPPSDHHHLDGQTTAGAFDSGFSEALPDSVGDVSAKQQLKNKIRPKSLAQQRWLECNC